MGDHVSNATLSDLVTMRARRDSDALNFARAILGQGLAMGWGDEAEAKVRQVFGDATYEQALRDIRNEYASYSQENPYTSGTAEFAGGFIPGAAMMLVPGGQGAGAGQVTRSSIPILTRIANSPIGRKLTSPLGRVVSLGTATGAVSGAGTAEEGSRVDAGVGGAMIGGTLGAAIPFTTRSFGRAKDWLMERAFPSEARITNIATQQMNRALRDAEMTPHDISTTIRADRALGVPSVVANVSPATAKLAEAVAQRTGRGATKVEKKLFEQASGVRERTQQQVIKGLHPGDYYADQERLISELRAKADPLYATAYAVGEVNDPMIMEMLKMPQFKGAWETARHIADVDAAAAKVKALQTGQPFDPNAYKLRDIYAPGPVDPATGVQDMVLTQIPDVRTLDYMKRGMDAQISAGYRSDNAATLATANAFKDLRNALRDRAKEVVPEYGEALRVYGGDVDVIKALEMGMKDFGGLRHEQVEQLVSKMGQAERDAFRTGVARNLYSIVMNPSQNINAAQRMIGSPEMQLKLAPLFENPGQFRLFKSALDREMQLFGQANNILKNSRTELRQQMSKMLEGDTAVGETLGATITGGPWAGLMNMTNRLISKAEVSEPTANKLADMLMSSDPHEVAAVVRLLEQGGVKEAQRTLRGGALEAGLTTGTTSAFWPAPVDTSAIPANIEADLSTGQAIQIPGLPAGPDIEADIARMNPP